MAEAEARADPHHISAYKLGRQIGSGAFGQVFLGTHHRTGQRVAIKLEPLSAPHPQLPHEARLYKSLCGEGVCQMYWHGTTADGHYALILELLGPSAEELLHKCRSTFSIATVSQLAITLLDRFEFIHSRGIVHRDVKPQNLAIRLPPQPHDARLRAVREGRTASFDALMVIDFGLARAFYTADGHISMRRHQGRAGTARYASMNTHRGLTQSRRDDLESIGYLLVFLHRGRLPWQGVRAASRKEKHLKICEAKARTPLAELCAAMPGMQEYLHYARQLAFDADPDYEHLRSLFLKQGHTVPADWAGPDQLLKDHLVAHLPRASAPRLDRPGGDIRPPPRRHESTDSAARALTSALEAVHETAATSGEGTAYERPASASALPAPQPRNSPRAVSSAVLASAVPRQHAPPRVPVAKRKRDHDGGE